MSEDETFGGGDSIVGKTLGGGGRGAPGAGDN